MLSKLIWAEPNPKYAAYLRKMICLRNSLEVPDDPKLLTNWVDVAKSVASIHSRVLQTRKHVLLIGIAAANIFQFAIPDDIDIHDVKRSDFTVIKRDLRSYLFY